MQTRSLVAALLLALPGLAAAQSTTAPDTALQAALVARSEAMFQAAQQQDLNSFSKVVLPDLLFVMRIGILTYDSMPYSGCELGGFTISHPQVRQVTAATATLVYQLHQNLSCNDTPEHADQFGTDNFVKQGADWMIAVHTQTPAGK